MSKRGQSQSKSWLVIAGVLLVPLAVTALVWILAMDKNVAVLNPQGTIAAHQKDLILFTLGLSATVIIPVFIMMAVFAWRYREGNHKAKYTPEHASNKWMEGIWWGIPIAIIGILSVVTWVSTHQLDPHKSLVSDVKPIKVQVVALQWKWLFLYPEQGIASVNALRFPVNTPVDFEITADAPMSSFWIPNLGTQVYAMNGMSSKLSLMASKPGKYRGSNTNISGEGYAGMNFIAEALPSKTAFERWVHHIKGDERHSHIDWNVFEELAKPSKNVAPSFYHLHDAHLYDKVINKYMSHGDTASYERVKH